MIDTKKLGMDLRKQRVASKLSQEALAERVGCSTTTISRFEADKMADLKLSLLENIAGALDVDVTIQLSCNHTVSTPSDISKEFVEAVTKKVVAEIFRRITSN